MSRVFICDMCLPIRPIEGPVLTLGFGQRWSEKEPTRKEVVIQEEEQDEEYLLAVTPLLDLCLTHANQIRSLLGLSPFGEEGISEEDEERNIPVEKKEKGENHSYSVKAFDKEGKEVPLPKRAYPIDGTGTEILPPWKEQPQ